MPWKENCAMDERIRFITACLCGEVSMSELCHEHGISRKTGYKWLDRYRKGGGAGLVERSHAPLQHGRRTAVALIAAIEEMRRERPSWGPRKIIAKLAQLHPQIAWPSASTAGDLLKRAGLVGGRRLRGRAPPRLGGLTQAHHANHVWRADHKGWIRLGDGTRSEPLTVTDGFSRYLVSLTATSSTSEAQAKPLFQDAFIQFGLPEVIRSDNGTPFASHGVTGLTQLSAWWIKLGIRHERIDPGSPQQNGSHERFHLTLKEAMTPPAKDLGEQQQRFAAFARDYNEERPHQALGQRPPKDFYKASPRPMPRHLPEPQYPSEVAARQVRSNGEIRWRGELVPISTALAGEAVGVEEDEQGRWIVRFFDVKLGIIDPKTSRLRPMPPQDQELAHKKQP